MCRWQQLTGWWALLYLSSFRLRKHRLGRFWMFCRGLQNAEMPPLCVCLHSGTGWGKATILISRLGKSHKRSRKRKTSKHHYKFGQVFAVLLASPPLAFVIFPSVLASPAEPESRSSNNSRVLPPCQSLCALPRQGSWGSSVCILHVAGNFCHLLLPFLPCLTKISLTK